MPSVRWGIFSGFAENVVSDLLTDPTSPNLPKEGRIGAEAHIEVKQKLSEALERRLGMTAAEYVHYKNRAAPKPEEQLGPVNDYEDE